MDGRQLGHGIGHGDTENQTLPKLIEAMRGKRVVQVSAGNMHSLVLTESGEVYLFRVWNYGQLGHGDKRTRLCPSSSRRCGASEWCRSQLVATTVWC